MAKTLTTRTVRSVMLIAEATAPSGERLVFGIGTDLECDDSGPEHKPTLQDCYRTLWNEGGICETLDGCTQFQLAPGWIVRLLDWRAIDGAVLDA